jgi:hypothetical protein
MGCGPPRFEFALSQQQVGVQNSEPRAHFSKIELSGFYYNGVTPTALDDPLLRQELA